MDDNNNGVNYGPNPVNNGGVNYGPDPINNGGQSYNNPNQQPPVYNTTGSAPVDPGQGMATAALVCGILGFCCCGIASFAAIILGAMARGKCTTESNRKKATAGLILGIVSLIISIIATIVNIATGTFSNLMSSGSSSYYSSYYGY